MNRLLNPNARIWRYMARLGDLFLLNFLFLVTSVPIITIGASATALYTVVFRFDTVREQGTFKSYFLAFRSEFKQATLLWLPILIFGIFLCVNLYLFASLGGYYKYINIFFGVLLALDLFVAAYAFPMLSQFNDSNKMIIVNSLVMSIAYFPRSFLIVFLNLLPWLVLILDFMQFMITAMIWTLFWFSIAAFFNSRLLEKPFQPFMNEEEEISE